MSAVHTQLEQEARARAEKAYPRTSFFYESRDTYAEGYIAGATREPSYAEVVAAARVLWAADDAETETSWPSNREFYLTTARAALDAARSKE